MQPLVKNETALTQDLYLNGIKEYYQIGHRLSRVLSVAYSFILLWCAGMLLSDFNLIVGIPFFIVAVLILFWQFKGYLISSKRSFKSFALLHSSHYQVDMEYRFFKDHLEQETERTELSVEYSKISHVYDLSECLLFVYGKQVIIMDKNAFVYGAVEDVFELMNENKVKIHTKRR